MARSEYHSLYGEIARRVITDRAFQRRARKALRRMRPLDRELFIAVRLEQVSIPELARRHGISEAEVEAALVRALAMLARTVCEPEPWWRRLWPW